MKTPQIRAIRLGIAVLGFFAITRPVQADLKCEDLESTYDRMPQEEKSQGYFVSQDEAVRRGGVGSYVQVVPEKDLKIARRCGSQEAGVVGIDLKKNPETIYFELGEATLTDQDFVALDSVADHLKTALNPPQVTISGFADKLGTPRINQGISHERAQAVQEYLESQGVPAKSLEIVAFGDERAQPLTSPKGNPSDRKVVISIG